MLDLRDRSRSTTIYEPSNKTAIGVQASKQHESRKVVNHSTQQPQNFFKMNRAEVASIKPIEEQDQRKLQSFQNNTRAAQ